MILERNICFVTTTLFTKWLNYQSRIVKKLFPESQHIFIDGRTNWPNCWFDWIDKVRNTNCKYFVHLDEDFFITDKIEFLKCFSLLENSDIIGCPDGYHQYRGANPVAINTFLLIGKTEILLPLDFENIKFGWEPNLGWINSHQLMFKDSYKTGWNFEFPIQGGANFYFQQEPYYAFLWKLKDNGCRFGYLYPHFDNRFNSTNPRISTESNDIGIHMWYTRNWFSQEIVHGMTNIERYTKLEQYLTSNHI